MRVVITGSSGGVPTSTYGTSGVFVQLHGNNMLFDCGEGTQQRMMKYDASINLDAIFLSHFDSDHTLGLPGLLRTMDMNNRDRPLDIYISGDVSEKLKLLIAGPHGWPEYKVKINEINSEGSVTEFSNFCVNCFNTKHDQSSYGYIIQEDTRSGRLNAEKLKTEYNLEPSRKYGELKKGNSVENDNGKVIHPKDVIGPKRSGRKLVYTGDCRTSSEVASSAEDADLLIHESTFHSEHIEKARQTNHSTSREAGITARKAGCDKLILTHISARHEGNEQRLEKDATKEFDGTVQVARDGFTTTVPFE